MLAQSFKTPDELKLTPVEFRALFQVLGMLERGEIEEPAFDMTKVGRNTVECAPSYKTPACIFGWAQYVAGEPIFLNLRAPNGPLGRLFMCDASFFKTTRLYDTAAAAIALRNFLTTGEPRWEEAVA